jgi:NAD(P)H-dependent FMN reductase
LFESADVEVLDLNDFEMPLFSVDREASIGQHPIAQQFLDKIASSDVLVISMAENNGNYSAAFKNTFDWASRINVKVFQEKPDAYGDFSECRGGASVLGIAQNLFPRYGGNIRQVFSLPSFNDNFDPEAGKISNAELTRNLSLS